MSLELELSSSPGRFLQKVKTECQQAIQAEPTTKKGENKKKQKVIIGEYWVMKKVM
ncbi:hypothetical protein [Desulfosediminicola sp.]|uniref:hypothetical protein n=1 Tax=Desulfosediminicola sp. TaxID=2886825 RepID=UPI003AF2A16F